MLFNPKKIMMGDQSWICWLYLFDMFLKNSWPKVLEVWTELMEVSHYSWSTVCRVTPGTQTWFAENRSFKCWTATSVMSPYGDIFFRNSSEPWNWGKPLLWDTLSQTIFCRKKQVGLRKCIFLWVQSVLFFLKLKNDKLSTLPVVIYITAVSWSPLSCWSPVSWVNIHNIWIVLYCQLC